MVTVERSQINTKNKQHWRTVFRKLRMMHQDRTFDQFTGIDSADFGAMSTNIQLSPSCRKTCSTMSLTGGKSANCTSLGRSLFTKMGACTLKNKTALLPALSGFVPIQSPYTQHVNLLSPESHL